MKVRIAAIQLAAHDRADFPARWPDIENALQAAVSEGANLVVLPEGTLPAYVLGEEPVLTSDIEPALLRFRQMARRSNAVIVVGAAQPSADGTRNSALVIDADGSIAGAADKHFLWHFDRRWFTPAQRIEPVHTQLGTIGAMICADGRIPLIARALVDRGAQILVMPTAWVTSGRDPRELENVQADLLARVRARENGVPFVAANKYGVEQRCVLYCGKSQIVDADGTIAVIASQDRQEIVSATIDLPRSCGPRKVPHAELQAPGVPCRIAVMAREPQDGDATRLRYLDADVVAHPGAASIVDDSVVLDPAGLASARLRGATLACWKTSIEPQWQTAFARARALELRMYVIVLDAAGHRAFAVDPDGAVVCGTIGGYEIASFAFDPAKCAMTQVAPGSDVLEGLARAARHAAL